MPDLLTAPDETPPAGVPEVPLLDPLEPCHDGAARAGCGACWAAMDALNEAARRG